MHGNIQSLVFRLVFGLIGVTRDFDSEIAPYPALSGRSNPTNWLNMQEILCIVW